MLQFRPSCLRSLTQRFARADRGTTAVEFALVSVPLLMLVFGILELGLVLLVVTTLDGATQSASRTIRTGEFQSGAATTAQDFKNLVCSKMTWLSAQCQNQLFIDVQTFSSFNGLANPPPIPPSVFDPLHPTPPCFSPGQPSDIVLVRTSFRWQLFTPLLNGALENMGKGSGVRLITSATAFRDEPFNSNAPVGQKC